MRISCWLICGVGEELYWESGHNIILCHLGIATGGTSVVRLTRNGESILHPHSKTLDLSYEMPRLKTSSLYSSPVSSYFLPSNAIESKSEMADHLRFGRLWAILPQFRPFTCSSVKCGPFYQSFICVAHHL